jgi:hypothetical protein
MQDYGTVEFSKWLTVLSGFYGTLKAVTSNIQFLVHMLKTLNTEETGIA